MNINLKIVKEEEKEILRNLLEKYEYEFSKYTKQDVNHLGLYGYSYLDYYWTEKNRWAYFIIVDKKLAGFVMVIDLPEVSDRSTDFQMAEFFILHKYRRMNVGKKAVFEIFNKHLGDWQLKVHPENKTSIHFWTNVINEYTNGKYEIIENYPDTEYEDNTLGNIYFFNTSKK